LKKFYEDIHACLKLCRKGGGKLKRKTVTTMCDLNLALFGRIPQTRFAILSSARSGSNFLHSMLKSHNNIQVYGEIFNIQSASPAILDQLFTNPNKYVEDLLNQKFAPAKKALGFKLFYNQMTAAQVDCEFYSTYFIDSKDVSKEEFEQIENKKKQIKTNYDTGKAKKRVENVWSYFKEDRKLKILHLKRENRLKQYLSLCRAWRSNEWICHTSKKLPSHKSIRIDSQNCLRYFNKMDQWEKNYHEIFKDNDTLEISYEKLQKAPRSQLKMIQAFLDIPIRKLNSPLQKQRGEPISIAIENYEELKHKFKGTCYEHFFSD
jgi:LPS sulfotransferase NodH